MTKKPPHDLPAKIRESHHLLALSLNHLSHARRQYARDEDPVKLIKQALRHIEKFWFKVGTRSPRNKSVKKRPNDASLAKTHQAVTRIAARVTTKLELLSKKPSVAQLTKKERRSITKEVLALSARMAEKTSAVTPRLPVEELLRPITRKGTEIADLSFDIYCPKAYKHHTRLTIWMPRVMANGDHVATALKKGRAMLKACGVREVTNYVIGLNSRINQYKETQLLMLDFDDMTYEELPHAELKTEPGVLLSTASGFHFLGLKPYEHREWRAKLKRLRKIAAKDHIDLSLQRGYSTLRMSASPRKPFAPIVWR